MPHSYIRHCKKEYRISRIGVHTLKHQNSRPFPLRLRPITNVLIAQRTTSGLAFAFVQFLNYVENL